MDDTESAHSFEWVNEKVGLLGFQVLSIYEIFLGKYRSEIAY
jgi:hypothetical protein